MRRLASCWAEAGAVARMKAIAASKSPIRVLLPAFMICTIMMRVRDVSEEAGESNVCECRDGDSSMTDRRCKLLPQAQFPRPGKPGLQATALADVFGRPGFPRFAPARP